METCGNHKNDLLYFASLLPTSHARARQRFAKAPFLCEVLGRRASTPISWSFCLVIFYFWAFLKGLGLDQRKTAFWVFLGFFWGKPLSFTFLFSVPRCLTDLNLLLWMVFLLKKTKPKKVNLFLVRKLRD